MIRQRLGLEELTPAIREGAALTSLRKELDLIDEMMSDARAMEKIAWNRLINLGSKTMTAEEWELFRTKRIVPEHSKTTIAVVLHGESA